MRSTAADLESVGGIHKDDLFLFKDGSGGSARVMAAVAEEFFWLDHLAGDVTVRCRVLRHESGIAFSQAGATEAYLSSDQICALLPYLSWKPGVIHIVAGADFMD